MTQDNKMRKSLLLAVSLVAVAVSDRYRSWMFIRPDRRNGDGAGGGFQRPHARIRDDL